MILCWGPVPPTSPYPDVRALVRAALAEDVAGGDVTTDATVPADTQARAVITQKAPGVVYGLAVAEEVFRELDPDMEVRFLTAEGVWRDGGEVLELRGSARALLTGERTALNFLAHLSGVATAAAQAARRGRRAPRRACSTRARRRPACERSRRRRWRRAARPTTGSASTTRS